MIRNTQSAPTTTTNTAQLAATTNTNPFTYPAGGQANLFYQLLPPVTSADHEMLCQSLTYYPLQPNAQNYIHSSVGSYLSLVIKMVATSLPIVIDWIGLLTLDVGYKGALVVVDNVVAAAVHDVSLLSQPQPSPSPPFPSGIPSPHL